MIGTIGAPVSIQVNFKIYEDLHKIKDQIRAINPELRDACLRATSKGAMKGTAKLIITAAVLGGEKAAVRGGGNIAAEGVADAPKLALRAAVADSFKMGYTAALSGTTVGLVSGIALGTNLLIESPLLIRSLYKIHRK